MGKVLQCPRPNVPYMPKGFSGIKRDQAGPSGITREPKWGYPHSGSTLLARIPRALPAPAAPLPEFWGAPQNSGKHKNNPREFRQAAPARFKNVALGPMFLKRTAAG